MLRYFDPAVSHEEMKRIAPGVMEKSARYDAVKVREYLLKRGFLTENIVRYGYRPFDARWLYWEPDTKLLDEKRSEFFSQAFSGNIFLFTTGRTRKSKIEPAITTKRLNDYNCMDSGARGFPLFLKPEQKQHSLFEQPSDNELKPNLSELATGYLKQLAVHPTDLFHHAVAMLHAPTYRQENSGALRQDWPRIPLPANQETLLASAELGKQIAALLDTETPVNGVTTGTVRAELKTVAVIAHAEGKQLSAEDLQVTAGWGHGGKGGITMPGKGRVTTREFTAAEQAAAIFGAPTCDVLLNNIAYWRNIPQRVWDYTIGGYQVMKKWLSYRELDLLGRALTIDEAREVMNMARRIAAILWLEAALDENYAHVKAATFAWQQ